MSILLPFTLMQNCDSFAPYGFACRAGCTGTSGQDGKKGASDTDTPRVSNIQVKRVVSCDVLVLNAHMQQQHNPKRLKVHVARGIEPASETLTDRPSPVC